MNPDDSNGETSFEIIDKKAEELSLSDRSVPTSPPSIISLGSSTSSSGNLLSNVKPPSSLPSFITTLPPVKPPVTSSFPTLPAITQPLQPTNITVSTSQASISVQNEPYYPTEFSAAIPPSKGFVTTHEEIPQPLPPQATAETGGLMNWMKDAMSSGGILSKVAERAKNSVDSMITTLDPQMREYIYSGGDLEILVASGQQEKVSAVREAFQYVFGKATVGSIPAQASNTAAQPVGFDSAITAAHERVDTVIKTQSIKDFPVVAVENFLLDIGNNNWFDLGVLVLEDRRKGISLQTFTQMTPVPAEVVALAREDTPIDYPQRQSGFSITIGGLMARNLQVEAKEWHKTVTGVSRREMILLAAKSLAYLYKKSISQ